MNSTWWASGLVLNRVAIVITILMSIALQIQPNVNIQGHVVRFSASDVLLIPSFFLVVNVIYKDPRELPLTCLYWAAAVCVALTISYLHYLFVFGVPTMWGTMKVVGGYVLFGYFIAGAALTVLGGILVKKLFAVSFVLATASLLLVYLFIALMPDSFGSLHVGRSYAGLTGNRNAVGLMLLLALCLALNFTRVLDRLIPPCGSWMIVALLLVGIALTASSSAWIGTTICLFFLLILRAISSRQFCIILAMIFGSFVLLTNVLDKRGAQVQFTLQKFVVIIQLLQDFREIENFTGPLDKDIRSLGAAEAVRESARYYSIAPRLVTNREAMRIWIEEPLTGKGLGYFIEFQENKKTFADRPVQIHNTLLWLLAELGLIGAGVFVGFIICVAVFLLKNSIGVGREQGNDGIALATSLLVFCVGWQIMSLFNELMYQRHVWFALGIAVGGSQRLRS